jgi:hypothetical protein
MSSGTAPDPPSEGELLGLIVVGEILVLGVVLGRVLTLGKSLRVTVSDGLSALEAEGTRLGKMNGCFDELSEGKAEGSLLLGKSDGLTNGMSKGDPEVTRLGIAEGWSDGLSEG